MLQQHNSEYNIITTITQSTILLQQHNSEYSIITTNNITQSTT